MSTLSMLRRGLLTAFGGMMFLWPVSLVPADLNPKAIKIELPKDIHWITRPDGALQANVAGDPDKPGIYVSLYKWIPGHMSRPHYHPNDRFIYVISGTWWVGTGAKFDAASTVPVPAGSFVTHYAKQIHYDGAKDIEAVIEIVGMGPATSVLAEEK